MDKVQTKLTVLYDDSFFVGVFEKIIDNKLYVAKYTFGSEPSEEEICNFVLNEYDNLKFSPAVGLDEKKEYNINPKRMKRMVKKQVNLGIGTKAQQALKLQQELNKNIKKVNKKIKREEMLNIKFEIKRKKSKEKHKGR